MVHVELDVLPPVVDAGESIETASFERGGNLLADDVFEILVLAGKLDMRVEVTMVDALDLDQNGQIESLGSGGTETRHTVNHELTS